MPYRMAHEVRSRNMKPVSYAVALAILLGCGGLFSGCSTIRGVDNLLNSVVGTANKAANKTINAAGNTASKALTPSTYKQLAQEAKKQSRSYDPPQRAKRTSARNHDATNQVSNSARKRGHGAAAYFRDAGSSSNKKKRR